MSLLLTKFLPHCNILITHDYYEDGWSRDFDLVPSASTLKHWRALEYRPRKTSSGLSVYYPTNGQDTDAQREISRPLKWQFALQPKSPHFLTYTELDFSLSIPLGRPFLYLTNYDIPAGTIDTAVDGDQNALLTQQAMTSNDDVIGLVSTAFSVPYDAAQHNRIEIWRLWPDQVAVQVAEEDDLNPTGAEHRVSVPPGTQGLHEVRWFGSSNREALVYIDPDLASSNALGVVEIFRTPPVDYSTVINYYAEFTRKSTNWRYYVVNNQAALLGNSLSIQYTGGPTFAYPITIDFEQVDPPDRSIEEQQAAERISSGEVILFRSEQLLPYFEQPLGGLELRITEGLNERTIVAHLPNPSVQQLLPNLFIQL